MGNLNTRGVRVGAHVFVSERRSRRGRVHHVAGVAPSEEQRPESARETRAVASGV